MKGIKIGNAFGNTMLTRQKSSRAQQEAKVACTEREETGRCDRTNQKTIGSEDGVWWVRSEIGGITNGSETEKTTSSSKETAGSQTGKTTANGQKTVDQTAKNTQQTFSFSNQNNITVNRFGQTNNLSPVNRQRLMQQKAKSNVKKKNLNYNRREISSQVLRANKLGSAARALASARTKVASLRRCIGTGQYDESELRIAISHAESIVKTAKKKISNLKEEQIKERRVAREKQANALKKQVKKQRVRAQRQQVKREMAMQRNQMERKAKMKEMRCKQLKRRHRGEELADVVEADIKYIKDMDRYRRSGQTNTTGTAALEIGDSAMRLSDLQRTEQALKYEEQQMSAEVGTVSASSASGGADFLGGDGISGGGEISADMGGGAAVDMAAIGGSVDVSL